MKFLTKQEQLFLAFVLGLLLTGWLVKWYRTAHPAATVHDNEQPQSTHTTTHEGS